MLTTRNAIFLLILTGCGRAPETCREHLLLGGQASDTYSTRFGEVYCEQSKDGGGWLLAYSNANNWLHPTAADVPIDLRGRFRFYDAKWALRAALDPNRLGRPWLSGPLLPNNVGAVNVAAVYASGLFEVRLEFANPTRSVARTCVAIAIDWSVEQDSSCATVDGAIVLRDGGSPLAGEIRLTIKEPVSEFASTPGYLALDRIDHMVSFWEHTNVFALGGDYQVRIWLREPH